MSLVTDIRTFLLADGTISGLVGTRIFPLKLPQAPTFPAITYQMISGGRSHTYGGAVGLASPRFQFDCWGATYLQAEALAEALRIRLDGFSGAMGASPSTVVQGVFFQDERDLYEDGADLGTGSGAGVYRRSIDYFISHEEDI